MHFHNKKIVCEIYIYMHYTDYLINEFQIYIYKIRTPQIRTPHTMPPPPPHPHPNVNLNSWIRPWLLLRWQSG